MRQSGRVLGVNSRTQSRSRFAAALRNFDRWAEKRAGKKRYNPLEPWVREYEDWDKLSAAFVQFLRERPVDDWNKRDIDLAHSAVLIDWAHHRLLRSLNDDELQDLLIRQYPDDAVRMHMLTRARHIANLELRQQVFLHFLEFDASDAVRDSAFESLAAMSSDRTEEYAEKFWQTHDEVRQLVVLQSLSNAKAPLLKKYLEKALSAGNPTLEKAATTISTMK